MQPTTNAVTAEPIEAITPAPQPSIISSVMRSIFVETTKDFFGGIKNFFQRYGRHYAYCFQYLWQPTLKNKTLSKLDWKENCQQSFELSLLVLFATIFMMKMEWIPQSSKEMMDMLSNDISQMGVEFLLFVGFAIAYVLFVSLSIFTGRTLRLMFDLPISRQESDILFTYLNNVFFSFTVLLALIIRCAVSQVTMGADANEMFVGMFVIYFLFYFPLLLIWSIRFCKKNNLSTGKMLFFLFLFLVPAAIFFAYCGTVTTALLLNV